MRRNFWNDETGFIISAELVLVATLLVIGMVVGLSEVQHAVVQELNDVADAIGALNQSYFFSGFHGFGGGGFGGGGFGRGGFGGGGFGGFGGCCVKGWTPGSAFIDVVDVCDFNQCMLACEPAVTESPVVPSVW